MQNIPDIDKYRRLWWLWPLGTLIYAFSASFLPVTTAPTFLIVLYSTTISGRWAGLTTVAVGSAQAVYLYGATDPWRAVLVSVMLVLIPPSILILRDISRKSQDLIEQLNGNLIKLREALVETKMLLGGAFSEAEARDHLLIIEDRLANLLTVSGLWVEISRQRREDIEKWERERESGK